MRTFAICSSDVPFLQPGNRSLGSLDIEGVPVVCGIVEAKPPAFDPRSAEQHRHVLVRVKAFSCNYRDKALILRMATSRSRGAFYAIGSEFVGEVVSVGSEVADLVPGERVIGNNAYPQSGVPGLPAGVPANHASHEFLVLHRAKLARIPEGMPDSVAASFSIAAQTTYSMIRRLDLPRGASVLVTAAKSNTSLFAIAAVAGRGFDLYALSTSDRFAEELHRLGVKELFVADPSRGPLAVDPAIASAAARIGGFVGVIDPYFDVYLPHMPAIMAVGGRYISCGLYDQYLGLVSRPAPPPGAPPAAALMTAIIKNISIIGNCIGSTEDLGDALADYGTGRLPVRIDRVFGGSETVAFLERTYNARDRFGKVVYAYD
jgi:NADPH:quinone reductase-like Zn-dependent oxidoreductase